MELDSLTHQAPPRWGALRLAEGSNAEDRKHHLFTQLSDFLKPDDIEKHLLFVESRTQEQQLEYLTFVNRYKIEPNEPWLVALDLLGILDDYANFIPGQMIQVLSSFQESFQKQNSLSESQWNQFLSELEEKMKMINDRNIDHLQTLVEFKIIFENENKKVLEQLNEIEKRISQKNNSHQSKINEITSNILNDIEIKIENSFRSLEEKIVKSSEKKEKNSSSDFNRLFRFYSGLGLGIFISFFINYVIK